MPPKPAVPPPAPEHDGLISPETEARLSARTPSGTHIGLKVMADCGVLLLFLICLSIVWICAFVLVFLFQVGFAGLCLTFLSLRVRLHLCDMCLLFCFIFASIFHLLIHMGKIRIYIICRVGLAVLCPFILPSVHLSCVAKTLVLDTVHKLLNQICCIPAIHIGTMNFCHVIPLSVTFIFGLGSQSRSKAEPFSFIFLHTLQLLRMKFGL